MGSYRCLATWPYMAEMHPAKRSTTTLPTPQPSTPELPRPVADVPGCFDDDGDDNVMDLWKSRHDMPGGVMEALERINLKLEAPALTLEGDAQEGSMTARIDALVEARSPGQSASRDPKTARALRKLAAGLGACADARSELAGAAPPAGGLLLRNAEARARELFAVVDPHGRGRCDAAKFESLMESLGLAGAQRDAVFAAVADRDADAVDEARFLAALVKHGALS